VWAAVRSDTTPNSTALRPLLRSTLLFADLANDELDLIASAGVVRSLRRNFVLFNEGDAPDELFVVISGLVAISNTSAHPSARSSSARSPSAHSPSARSSSARSPSAHSSSARSSTDGRESLIALMGPGDLFGELGFLDGFDRSAQARTLEDTTVLAVPYAPLRAIYENNPNALWNAVRLLGRRLRSMDQALSDAVFLDVMGRTAKRLLEIADGAEEFDLPVTQEELAAMVGASRERVNKAIATFVKLGWITQHKRHYTITDREHLTIRAL